MSRIIITYRKVRKQVMKTARLISVNKEMGVVVKIKFKAVPVKLLGTFSTTVTISSYMSEDPHY